jgi:hypothetical protein
MGHGMMYFSIFVIVLNFHILALRIWDMPEVGESFHLRSWDGGAMEDWSNMWSDDIHDRQVLREVVSTCVLRAGGRHKYRGISNWTWELEPLDSWH